MYQASGKNAQAKVFKRSLIFLDRVTHQPGYSEGKGIEVSTQKMFDFKVYDWKVQISLSATVWTRALRYDTN